MRQLTAFLWALLCLYPIAGRAEDLPADAEISASAVEAEPPDESCKAVVGTYVTAFFYGVTDVEQAKGFPHPCTHSPVTEGPFEFDESSVRALLAGAGLDKLSRPLDPATVEAFRNTAPHSEVIVSFDPMDPCGYDELRDFLYVIDSMEGNEPFKARYLCMDKDTLEAPGRDAAGN